MEKMDQKGDWGWLGNSMAHYMKDLVQGPFNNLERDWRKLENHVSWEKMVGPGIFSLVRSTLKWCMLFSSIWRHLWKKNHRCSEMVQKWKDHSQGRSHMREISSPQNKGQCQESQSQSSKGLLKGIGFHRTPWFEQKLCNQSSGWKGQVYSGQLAKFLTSTRYSLYPRTSVCVCNY